MSLTSKQENKSKDENSEKNEKFEKGDITKNILNKVSYFINKKLNNKSFNKIDSINENMQLLLNEYEKQNKYLCNKINVLESLLILMNKDMNELKKKLKNKNFVCLSPIDDKNKIDSDFNESSILNNIIEENMNNDNTISINNTNNTNNTNNIIDNTTQEQNINTFEEIPIMKVNSFSNFYKDIKKEKLELDNNFVKKCLESHNINSDLKIFKKIYIDNIPNSCYSLRAIKGNYQYWLNNKMNDDDENGTYIKDIIIHNISNAYLEANNFDDYLEDNDLFIKNQEYILNMNKQKYIDKLFTNILKLIRE
jgi:hypothetical protein